MTDETRLTPIVRDVWGVLKKHHANTKETADACALILGMVSATALQGSAIAKLHDAHGIWRATFNTVRPAFEAGYRAARVVLGEGGTKP